MKYTRYDYKKKKKGSAGKFVLSMILFVFSAVIIGTGIAWVASEIILFNNTETSDGENNQIGNQTEDQPTLAEVEDEEEAQDVSAEVITNINTNFTLVQCGVFSSEENANQLLDNIAIEVEGFIVEEEELYRVFAGVYTIEEAENIVNNLKSKDIDSVKVNYRLDEASNIESQIAAIVNGYLDILKNTFDDEVKSINTKTFKEWVGSLEAISEGEGVEILNSIKDYVKTLPEEIEKEDVSKEMAYLYTILLEFK